MIDWLTLRLDLQTPSGEFRIPPLLIEKLRDRHGRILAISAGGEIEFETTRWESVRSDSHQLVARVTDALWIQGSPARVDGVNNVFGSDSVVECFRRMVLFASKHLDVMLPLDPTVWKCTRIDVTQNFDLVNTETVRDALLLLKQSEGGHYQTQTSSETIYWNQRSRLRSGKAYGKGAHLRKQVRKNQAQASSEQCDLADRLLRLELKLGAQFWRENRSGKAWHEWTEQDVRAAHESYFAPLVGNLRIKDMGEKSLEERVIAAAPSKGQGRSAWGTYLRIKAEGFRHVQESMNRRSWFRHRKILLAAGIPLSQLQSGTVVPLVKHRAIVLGAPVRSWEELAAKVA